MRMVALRRVSVRDATWLQVGPRVPRDSARWEVREILEGEGLSYLMW